MKTITRLLIHPWTKSLGVFSLAVLAVTSLTVPYVMLIMQHKSSIKFKSKFNSTGSTTPSVFDIPEDQLVKLVALEHLCTTQVATLPNLRHGIWYLTTITGKNKTSLEISSFGAYLDTRNSRDTVRVLGVSNADISLPVYCQLWYTEQEAAVVVNATVEDNGRGMNIKTLHFQERMYSCVLPDAVKAYPKAVSLAFAKCDTGDTANPIPINVALSTAAAQTHNIGLCTAVTYGSVNSLKLIEWIEFNRILGITEINFYVHGLPEGAETVLRYYEQLGLVRVRRVAPPTVYFCYWCLKLATIAVLNDCMYRNMYRYRYMAVIDIDELIVPRRHATLNDLVSHLDLYHPGPAYIFSNAYFFLDLPSTAPENNTDIGTMLLTIVKLHRLKPSNPGQAMKSVVDPRLCIVMQNHYCMKRSANVSAKYWTTVVKEDLALVHHYKKCHLESSECERITEEYIMDNSTLRFRDNLLFHVQETLQNLTNSTDSETLEFI